MASSQSPGAVQGHGHITSDNEVDRLPRPRPTAGFERLKRAMGLGPKKVQLSRYPVDLGVGLVDPMDNWRWVGRWNGAGHG